MSKGILVNCLKKFDALLRLYLGFEEEKIHPQKSELIKGRLLIYSTSSFKRYTTKDSWENFKKFDLKSCENPENLGKNIGNTIAKNLVISFEVPKIKEFKS